MDKSFAFVALVFCVVACGRNGENALSQSEAQGDTGYYRVYPNQAQKNYVQYYDEKSGKYYWVEDTRYKHQGGYYYAPSRGWQGQGAGAGAGAGRGYYKNDYEGQGYVPNPGRYYVERYAPHAAHKVPKYIPAPKHKHQDVDTDEDGYTLVEPGHDSGDYDSDSKSSWRNWGRSIGRYYRDRYGN